MSKVQSQSDSRARRNDIQQPHAAGGARIDAEIRGAREDESDSYQQFFTTLRRRKGVMLLVLLIALALAAAYSFLRDPAYESSADVLITGSAVTSALSDFPGLSSPDEPDRNAKTQAKLARLPLVASAVIKAAPLFETPEVFLNRSGVSVEPNADILRFTVEDPDPDQARRLVTIYAREFAAYRNALDVQAIRATRSNLQRALERLAAEGKEDSAVYTELRKSVEQLNAAEVLQGSAALLVQPGVSSEKVRPRTKRNLLIALMLGLLAGIGVGLMLERLDNRVRTPEEVERALRLPVIGELSLPPKVSGPVDVTMLSDPHGSYAEGIRKLRVNLEFLNLDRRARVIMVTSASGGEGKSTVAADLAVALARAGSNVVLCDLDSRVPSVGERFGLGDRRGLAEVVTSVESVEGALVNVPLHGGPVRFAHTDVFSLRSQSHTDDLLTVPGRAAVRKGRLDVLPFGRQRPPNPGDFVGTAAVRETVARLANSYEFVVIDTPPLLPVSDALTIGEYVDAALIVCRLRETRLPTLRRLHRLIAAFPAHVFGLVVTDAPETVSYGPSYYAQGASLSGATQGSRAY